MSNREAIDLLVEWCSVVGAGSREQFDRACQNILDPDEKPGRLLENLEVMGHVEVDWPGGGRWAANPPALALAEGSGGNAVLVGGRTLGTWTTLAGIVEEGVAKSLESVAKEPGFPSTWYVGISSTTMLARIASRLGAVAITSPADVYLDHFLDLDHLLEVSTTEFPYSGFRAQQLDARTLLYSPVDVTRGNWPPGGFRQLFAGRYHYFFVDDTQNVHLLDRWATTHAELRRQMSKGNRVPEVLQYDPDRERMAVRASGQLPAQWARAAMICTGIPPRRSKQSRPWKDVYEGVPPLLYKKICDFLGREDLIRPSDLSDIAMGPAK
mgnify:CR=1 FL=1|jgi:hypothetical protein|tara:strand:+ start:683 stop:1657 length:975 start_codon:yes stop_codon:yes gene_type:complete